MEYSTLFTRLLLVVILMSGTSIVRSQTMVTCNNVTDANPICFIAEVSRDSRLRDWSTAENYCKTLNGGSATLPIISSSTVQFYLTEFLLKNDFTLDSVWLGGSAFSNGFGWTWVNGNQFSDASLAAVSLSLNVASIAERMDGNVTVGTFIGRSMVDYADGYICQFTGKMDCSGSIVSASYYDSNSGSCFARYDESIGWYLARNKCVMRGGDLAILTDQTNNGINATLSRLSYQPPTQPNGIWKQYWIGLRKIWWNWVSDGSEIKIVDLRDSASLDNQNNATQNCLAIDYKQQFAWSARDCSTKLQTICQSGSWTTTPPTTPSPNPTTPTVSLPTWAVGLICGLAGLVYIVSLIVVGIVCCKCCGNKTSKKTDDGDGENRRSNNYISEPNGGGHHHASPQGPPKMPRVSVAATAPADDYEDYHEDEFDEYENYEIPEEKRNPPAPPGGVYANTSQISGTPGRGKRR